MVARLIRSKIKEKVISDNNYYLKVEYLSLDSTTKLQYSMFQKGLHASVKQISFGQVRVATS